MIPNKNIKFKFSSELEFNEFKKYVLKYSNIDIEIEYIEIENNEIFYDDDDDDDDDDDNQHKIWNFHDIGLEYNLS